MKKTSGKKGLPVSVIVVALIVIVVAIFLIINLKKGYKINVNGKEYICTIREKFDESEPVLGYSKEKYSSVEEAREGCKQDEIIIYNDSGELEEYQEKRKDCTFKEEDDEKL